MFRTWKPTELYGLALSEDGFVLHLRVFLWMMAESLRVCSSGFLYKCLASRRGITSFEADRSWVCLPAPAWPTGRGPRWSGRRSRPLQSQPPRLLLEPACSNYRPNSPRKENKYLVLFCLCYIAQDEGGLIYKLTPISYKSIGITSWQAVLC